MRTVLLLALVACSASVAAQAPSADPNAKGTAVIRGRILTAGGRPARRALVRILAPAGGVPRTVTANLEGRYEFTDVRAGDYRVSAGKPGFVALEYGQQRAFEHGKVLTVRAGETIEKIDITLPGSGAISGRVFDEHGDPLEAVSVKLMQLQFGANRRQLLPVIGVGARVTDDRGAYRVYGVPPGEYLVMASVADGSRGQPVTIAPPGHAPTFYPGTPKASEAQAITVGLAQDVSEIDFKLARVPTASISGVVTDSQGRPARVSVWLAISQRSGGLTAEPIMSGTGLDGSFQIRNVPPGEWVLQAVGVPSAQREGEFTSQFLTVDGRDITDLSLQMSAGSRVEGHVVFDGVGDVAPTSVVLTAPPSDFDRAPLGGGGPGRFIQVAADGTFALDGLNGPRRIRLVRAPESWTLKAVVANGVDVTDTPLSFGTKEASLTGVEIVLTNKAGRVGGGVTDASGRPVTDYTVVVFSTSADRWYQGSRFFNFTKPRSDGSFTVAGLPPAEYYVAAVDWMQGNEGFGEWQDPNFLNAIAPRAARVIFSEGQSVSLTLRLIVR
jgi:protocatechuate 3,4-dioxygenase beta subunit